MFTSLLSLLLGRPTRPDVAMTGEITLRGLVLPVGGLKEKTLAAKQAGIKTVILPARNKKDLPDVPKEAKKGLKFEFVKNTTEVLKVALNADLT
jgi:ATP-dependent Lon protease